ncbi:MAG: hypothetical protein IPL61_01895 [Myxococcales bacterium]|nr:hypothetical protein [Myxococcales bacterium]
MTNKLLMCVLALGLAVAPACGKKAGAGADKIDVVALKDGATQTARLSFWSKNRGLAGEDLVDNVHFEDASKQSLALRYDPALEATMAKLVQGKIYKVTFAVKDDGVHKGTVTAVE